MMTGKPDFSRPRPIRRRAGADASAAPLDDPTAIRSLLLDAAARGASYLERVNDRRVTPELDAINRLDVLDIDLPDEGMPARDVLRLLDVVGSPATIASAGGRYFGLVIGGALPATVAANWLAAAWDQNAVFRWTSPVSAKLEDVTLKWLGAIFGLPDAFGGAFVSGASMATLTALASARHVLLSRAGWDVEAQGLNGAPELRIIVGGEVHITVLKALSLLGLGRDRVIRTEVDDQGRIRPDTLPPLDDRTILCLQAGNVNTGSFDPFEPVCGAARKAGAWVHVDGAFGLWAMASAAKAELARGCAMADSWATDGHKWLNVPYDSGIVLVRRAADLRAAMSANAAYLAEGVEGDREPSHYTPELSRRARAVEIWAALSSLGRSGLAELVESSCRHAVAFAEGLRSRGFEVLNEVVLNQVLVSFGSPEITRRTIALLQEEGVCWCGGTVWQGHTAMRISVSGWATNEEDVEVSLEAMDRAARRALKEAGGE
ncbi:MAG TPA: pyridoxal-dependent decarboxylase [Sphingomicrobium sp.]|nr:pyridoxal-dependent decarboxylase [Sphingomicrobium sp.]